MESLNIFNFHTIFKFILIFIFIITFIFYIFNTLPVLFKIIFYLKHRENYQDQGQTREYVAKIVRDSIWKSNLPDKLTQVDLCAIQDKIINQIETSIRNKNIQSLDGGHDYNDKIDHHIRPDKKKAEEDCNNEIAKLENKLKDYEEIELKQTIFAINCTRYIIYPGILIILGGAVLAFTGYTEAGTYSTITGTLVSGAGTLSMYLSKIIKKTITPKIEKIKSEIRKLRSLLLCESIEDKQLRDQTKSEIIKEGIK